MKKEKIELAVCKKFVELYNKKFKKDFSGPSLSNGQPPDCITYNRNDEKDFFELEVTVASPEEAENFGRNKEYESIADLNNFNSQISRIYSDIKNGKIYDEKTKSKLTLLLQASNIEYDDEDLSKITKIIGASNIWREKFRQLGFKQIWYVSTKNIYNIFGE